MEMLGSPREMQLLMLKKENYVLILLLDLPVTFRNMKPSARLMWSCHHCTVQCCNRALKRVHEKEFGTWKCWLYYHLADGWLKGPNKKLYYPALAGVTQWIECQPANRKVTGSIPSQGTCLGCRPGPQLGACERQPTDVSLTHWYFCPFLPFPSL